MDAHTPRHEDDLSDFERRLAGWQPASEAWMPTPCFSPRGKRPAGAGGASCSGRRCVLLLAVQAAGLGVWGLSERAERQALASRLPERAPTPAPPRRPVAVVPESSYEPSPGDYLSTRRQLEQDPNGWLASVQPAGLQALGPPPPHPAILTPRQRDGLFDQ